MFGRKKLNKLLDELEKSVKVFDYRAADEFLKKIRCFTKYRSAVLIVDRAFEISSSVDTVIINTRELDGLAFADGVSINRVIFLTYAEINTDIFADVNITAIYLHPHSKFIGSHAADYYSEVREKVCEAEEKLLGEFEAALQDSRYSFALTDIVPKLQQFSEFSNSSFQFVNGYCDRIFGDIVIVLTPMCSGESLPFIYEKRYSLVAFLKGAGVFGKKHLYGAKYIEKLYLPPDIKYIEYNALRFCRIKHLYASSGLKEYDASELVGSVFFIHLKEMESCIPLGRLNSKPYFPPAWLCVCIIVQDVVIYLDLLGDIYLPSTIRSIAKGAYQPCKNEFRRCIYLPDNLVNASFLRSVPEISRGVFVGLYKESKSVLISLNSWYSEYFDKNPQYLMDIFETNSSMFMFCLENGFVTRNAAEYLLEGSTDVELNAYLLQHLY